MAKYEEEQEEDEGQEPPLRRSLFANVPPFLNYLPNGLQGREVRSCQAHTDTMVELRYSLWRIPMAFHTMVTTVEEENTNKEKNCKIRESTLILPDVVMREKRSGADKSKRNSLFRKSQVVQDENVSPFPLMKSHHPPNTWSTGSCKSGSNELCGAFLQHPDDAKAFMASHHMVKLEPFPGFHQITRKDWLWRSFQRMQEKFGQDNFDFLARSLIVPQQRDELVTALREEPEAWWIVKPPGRNNGSGIYLINSEDEVPDREEEEVLVQRYMARPYLINGCKFDLRVYVLITSVDPLRIYIYDEGLVRFCVNEYTMDPDKIKDNQMHVCNYDINKNSLKFTNNEDPFEAQGHKWTLSALWKSLAEEPPKPSCLTVEETREKLEELVIKSVLCGLSSFKQDISRGQKKEMKSTYNMYKLLGFDILLDDHRRPHLIEINSRPACLNNKLDAFVNRPMISEMFKIVGYHLPLHTLATPEKKAIACKKLNIPDESSAFKMGFNSMIYATVLDDQSTRKQKQYHKDVFERSSYKDTILEELTSSDVRVLLKTAEEKSQTRHFSRVFPTPTSHTYFAFFDSLSYHDKLLDAFESTYAECYEEGVKVINEYCTRNSHQ